MNGKAINPQYFTIGTEFLDNLHLSALSVPGSSPELYLQYISDIHREEAVATRVRHRAMGQGHREPQSGQWPSTISSTLESSSRTKRKNTQAFTSVPREAEEKTNRAVPGSKTPWSRKGISPGKGSTMDAHAETLSCLGTLSMKEEKGSHISGLTPAASQVYCLRNRNLRNMFKKGSCSL